MARAAKTHVEVRSGRSRVSAMTVMLVLLPLVSGRPLSAFQQDGDQARAAAEDAQERVQRLLAASQFGRGKLALESGQIGEALNWYLQSYLNSPADSPLRTSARNVIGANIGQITHTLVHPETVRAVASSSDGTRMSIVYQGRAVSAVGSDDRQTARGAAGSRRRCAGRSIHSRWKNSGDVRLEGGNVLRRRHGQTASRKRSSTTSTRRRSSLPR